MPEFKTIETLQENHVFVIKFNRPKKYNSLSPQLYDDWSSALEYAKNNETIRVVVVTGNGKFFTAGHEISVPDIQGESMEEYIERRVGVTKNLLDTMITYPKLIVHAVNGPTLGFGVTSTALVDFVYTVPDATFKTPFMELALCVEGCSSFTFPLGFGRHLANELLFMGKTITAKDWEHAGLASILPKENFLEKVLEKAHKLASYSPEAVRESLKIVRHVHRDTLLKMNELEMKLLVKRMSSQDFFQAMERFMSKKSKL